MEQPQKLSDKLSLSLEDIEVEIRKFITTHEFYLDFCEKSWAACTAGQSLLAMTTLAVNLKYDIEKLKRYGL
jgi:hypothetical protein